MFFATILVLSSVGIFFVKLNIQLLLLLVLISNLCYFWSVMFTLGNSKVQDKKNDSSFARIRTSVLFCTFFQIVAFVASFAEGFVGGTCTQEVSLPILFDILYGLQFIPCFVFLCEKAFGFGKKKMEEKMVGGNVVKVQKRLEVKLPEHAISETMFRNMSFYAAIFSALLGPIKIGIMVLGRMIIVTD